jgi:hypothetical protein
VFTKSLPSNKLPTSTNRAFGLHVTILKAEIQFLKAVANYKMTDSDRNKDIRELGILPVINATVIN